MKVADIKPGMRFNKLTVIRFLKRDTDGAMMFECKCDCGNITVTRGSSLISSHTKSCGRCLEREMVGKRFGKLTVISVSHRDKSKRNALFFKCKCDCGGETIVSSLNLRQGKTKTCGNCINNIIGKKFSHLTVLEHVHSSTKSKYIKVRCDCGNEKNMLKLSVIHGRFKTCGDCYKAFKDSYKPDIKRRCAYLNSTYDAIMNRCNNPYNVIYYVYGGRGIKCDFSREAFVKEYYMRTDIDIENLQVDRIDNDKNYSFDNIRWVTSVENVNNRLFNSKLTHHAVACRLLSMISFNRAIISMNEYNKNDYIRVKFPLFTKSGESLFLFIHKSLKYKKEYYVNRIVSFYKNDGREIEIDTLHDDERVVRAVDEMIEFYKRNSIMYDKTLRTFYDTFMNMKLKHPEFDDVDIIDVYDTFVHEINTKHYHEKSL